MNCTNVRYGMANKPYLIVVLMSAIAKFTIVAPGSMGGGLRYRPPHSLRPPESRVLTRALPCQDIKTRDVLPGKNTYGTISVTLIVQLHSVATDRLNAPAS